MFWLKGKEKNERHLLHLNAMLAKSFANVKRDTQVIFQWLQHFHAQNQNQQQLIQNQQQQIAHLHHQLQYVPKKPEDIKKVVDSFYSYEAILERLRAINEKIESLEKTRADHPIPEQKQIQPHLTHSIEQVAHPHIEKIQERLTQLEQQRQGTIREKVVQRIAKHSKEYVKSLILSYIRKHGQISALQLHDLIVVDQGLCSKSSFYRVLEELESAHDIGVARQGKQKFYLYKAIKQH